MQLYNDIIPTLILLLYFFLPEMKKGTSEVETNGILLS